MVLQLRTQFGGLYGQICGELRDGVYWELSSQVAAKQVSGRHAETRIS
jgi:hypothetical protein